LLNQDSAISSFNLATIYYERKRYDLAQRWFTRFENTLSISKTLHSAATLSVGWQLAKASGNKNAADTFAFKLKKRFPKSTEYKLTKSKR